MTTPRPSRRVAVARLRRLARYLGYMRRVVHAVARRIDAVLEALEQGRDRDTATITKQAVELERMHAAVAEREAQIVALRVVFENAKEYCTRWAVFIPPGPWDSNWTEHERCLPSQHLRMVAVPFDCADFVDGREIEGGHELWDRRNPTNCWRVFSSAAWAVLTASALRLWSWLANHPFTWPKEVTFWALAPLFLFLVFSHFQIPSGVGSRALPQLSGTIDRIHLVGPHVGGAGATTTLVLVATIRNSGAPSMVDCCTLEASVPSSGTVAFDPLRFPETVVITDETGKESMKLYGVDDLTRQTVAKTIGAGEIVRGVLIFQAQHASLDTLARAGTRYHLTFLDVDRVPHGVNYDLPATPTAKWGYTPGLHQEP